MRAEAVAEMVAIARRFLDAMEHFHAVTGPQAVVEKVHAQTGCEPNDNLLRQAERRLRADGLEATFTIQRAIDDLSAGASVPGELR